jgi:hypothetical protein
MGPWDRFVIMLLPIVFILSITGIIILRPLSKRLGDLLELMVRDRRLDSPHGIHEVIQRLDAIEARIARIEGPNAIEKRVGPEGRSALGDGDSEG